VWEETLLKLLRLCLLLPKVMQRLALSVMRAPAAVMEKQRLATAAVWDAHNPQCFSSARSVMMQLLMH
jgi:hypothetical protein